MEKQNYFRVTDLKEYSFCPRVLYYENCLPDLQPTTYKMNAGVRAHEREQQKAKRRTLSAYGLSEGERHFDVHVESARLGLIGEIDEVVIAPDEVLVIDYKLSKQVSTNFKHQLVAYAMLLEESWQVTIQRGFIYLIQSRQVEALKITAALRQQVEAIVADIHRIVETELMPLPAKNERQCVTCKHRRFCNDV